MKSLRVQNMLEKYRSLSVQVRASLWFVISAVITRGITIITTPIFSRLLSTEEYGQYNVFNSWESIVVVFVTLNIYYAGYTQGLVKFENDRKRFTTSTLGLLSVFIVGWYIIYSFFSGRFNLLLSLSKSQITAMFVIMWSTGVFEIWRVRKRFNYEYKKIVLLSIAVAFTNPIVGIILVTHSTNRVDARIWGTAAVNFLLHSWMFFVLIKEDKHFFEKKYWRYVTRLSFGLIPHYLALRLLSSSDRIMVSRMVGDSEAGIYSLAYSISQIMSIFSTAIQQALEPWIYSKIKNRNLSEIGRIAYFTMILDAGLNLMVIILAPEIVAIFAPASYSEAIYVIPPVVMSVFFMFSYFFFSVFELFYEKTNYITIATCIGAGVNVILNYLFIPVFGYIAAAYTTLTCYLLFVFMHYFFMHKICKERHSNIRVYKIKYIFAISAIFVSIGTISGLLYDFVIARYCILVAILIIAFLFRKRIMIYIRDVIKFRRMGKAISKT